jgi:predicted DNA-binding transcriptional regulator YafY
MAKSDFIHILQRMDRMIRTRSTGSPEDFACRLSISERSLYNYLAVMRELGAPLHYSRTYESYLYREEGRFLVEFKKQAEPDYAI